MSLSVGLQIAGVDDYIQQNLVCVMPLKETPPQEHKGAAKISLGGPEEGNELPKLTKVTVRLEDCLACSGCITSAETVLIEQQGLPEFRKNIKELSQRKKVICTIADECIASMSVVHNQPFNVVWTRVEKALKKEGVDELRDLSQAQDISLFGIYDEFKEYQKMNKVLLTSTCPGWVCYSEKMQGKWMFEYMSKVASSMTIAGMIMKKQNSEIYHVSIQMCFDKKLEATKTYNNIHVIDCVLTTSEIDSIIDWNEPINEITSTRMKGFISSPAQYIALMEQKKEPFKVTRNKDFLENDGIAIANGFRNIQNVVRFVKSKTKLQFIEVEACPGGCICGGGQIKCSPKEKDERVKKMMEILEPKVVDEKNKSIYESIKDSIKLTFNDRKESAQENALHLNW
ncbi:iron hydrogenase [Entamoeba histolytica HM-3:IMSS]|uniref:Iron hydrogenase n=1 Tax=Entamoeba histolytica HM-3:IMSS TaxID=885315 RepID=M7W2V8_ENTHI|nr:iron hydrogenase [Entamoeba histolytica HM-3:IMSS]